jgi:hypothetical protein
MSEKPQETSQLMIDLSAMIEYKINQRNDLAKKSPRPNGIIQIIDREIDILEQIEIYIPLMEQNNTKRVLKYRNKYFNIGVISGKLELVTGREHPISYFE